MEPKLPPSGGLLPRPVLQFSIYRKDKHSLSCTSMSVNRPRTLVPVISRILALSVEKPNAHSAYAFTARWRSKCSDTLAF